MTHRIRQPGTTRCRMSRSRHGPRQDISMEETFSGQEDYEIIQRILDGDTEAFEVIVRRYETYLFAILRKHIPMESINDVAHDVMINAYTSLSGYGGKSAFKHWLATIAVRTCHDYWRKSYKSREIPLSALSEEHQQWLDMAAAANSHEAYKDKEFEAEGREMLCMALGCLDATDRMIVSLVYLEELPVKEAAALLGLSMINVKVKAHRARARMRKHLAKLLTKR